MNKDEKGGISTAGSVCWGLDETCINFSWVGEEH